MGVGWGGEVGLSAFIFSENDVLSTLLSQFLELEGSLNTDEADPFPHIGEIDYGLFRNFWMIFNFYTE